MNDKKDVESKDNNVKSKEELIKDAENRLKEWDELKNSFKENPSEPVTKEEITKIVEFIEGNLVSMAHVIGNNGHNIAALINNFQQIMRVFGGGEGPAGGQRTKSGIIIP